MTSIVGIDWSSTQIDACLLVPGSPPDLRRFTLGKATGKHKVELEDRLRRVADTMIDACAANWRLDPAKHVVVENAYRNETLQRTLGAIIASVPMASMLKVIAPQEWRKALGAKNTKIAGHIAVEKWLLRETKWAPFDLDEHELDAIGIALAWQRILASQATP